jgi:peptide/nickel transport system substrate-binding protein
MNRIARILFCAAIAASLAGCSSNPSANTTGGAAPKFVPGTLRIADIEEPDTLNPYISTVITSIDLSYLCGSYFYNIDDKDRFVPEVALDVPTLKNGGVSADEAPHPHSARGIRVQDGVPLTKDIIFVARHHEREDNVQTGRVTIRSATHRATASSSST